MEGSSIMEGIQVMLIFSFSVVGACAQFFVNVTGLDERNISYRKDTSPKLRDYTLVAVESSLII